MKFQRNYQILIETAQDEAIKIDYPLTINFNVNRSISSSLNQLNLTIFNLGEEKRNLIFQDKYNLFDFGKGLTYKKIILKAGYGDRNLPIIFIGNILEAFSSRQGSDIVTEIYAVDGLYGTTNSFVSQTFGSGTTFKGFISSLFSSFKNIIPGSIGENDEKFERGVVASGNVYDILKSYFGDRIFIDKEEINFLNDDEVKDLEVFEASSSTGLLKTPQRQDTWLVCDLLFEPNLTIGQLISIKSDVNKLFNGQYRIDGIQHQGTFSGAVGGEAMTTLQLFVGTRNFNFKKV